MRLYDSGYPLIILSHRRREFIGQTMLSIRDLMKSVTDVYVVDDSGDPEHRGWLEAHRFNYSAVASENAGYLEAMKRVWHTANMLVRDGAEYVMLWEEDFRLAKALDLEDMANVLRANPTLAQLNLQRQAVYSIERRLGYMESHRRRGYELSRLHTGETKWIKRKKPFTTNPGMITPGALAVSWPNRETCDQVSGGAEPAMDIKLRQAGFEFGWLGGWNSPHVTHVGTDMKSGHGY